MKFQGRICVYNVLVLIVALSLSPTVLSDLHTCSGKTRCSECVWDPTDGMLPPDLRCGWCATTGRCIEVANGEMIVSDGSSASVCPDFRVRGRDTSPSCPDMWCSAAYTTNNIYFCRATNIVALVFALLLFVGTIPLCIWTMTIRQLPWRYEPHLSRSLLADFNRTEIVIASESVRNGTDEMLSDREHGGPAPRGVQSADAAATSLAGSDSRNDRSCVGYDLCPMCKMPQPWRLGPGEVCHWCDVARLSFMPLFMGSCSATLTIVLIFALSLKPWFADYYYGFTLIMGYGSYALSFLWIWKGRYERIKITDGDDDNIHVAAQRLLQRTLYVQLALRLRGRSITSVFPDIQQQCFGHGEGSLADNDAGVVNATQETGGPSAPSREEAVIDDAPTNNNNNNNNSNDQPPLSSPRLRTPEPSLIRCASSDGPLLLHSRSGSNPFQKVKMPQLPETLVRQRRAETAQLLAMDKVLRKQLRDSLKNSLHRDEFILWCTKPPVRTVIAENEWLITDLIAGLLFGVWLIVLSSLTDDRYAMVRLSGSTAVAVCGLCCIVAFALLLVTTVRGCSRLYVLTNERLLTFYSGLLGPVVTATDISSVRYTGVCAYTTPSRTFTSVALFSFPFFSMFKCLSFCGDSGETTPAVTTFTWEVPSTERKLPPIKSHSFPGITDMSSFLYFFRLAVPKQAKLQQQQHTAKRAQYGSMRDPDRLAWRQHLFLCTAMLLAAPLMVIYPRAVPPFLSVSLLVLLLMIVFSTAQRGLRSQRMTFTPVSLADGQADAAGRWGGAESEAQSGSRCPPLLHSESLTEFTEVDFASPPPPVCEERHSGSVGGSNPAPSYSSTVQSLSSAVRLPESALDPADCNQSPNSHVEVLMPAMREQSVESANTDSDERLPLQ